jgi:cysteine desulfurase/selenocysteine lyase
MKPEPVASTGVGLDVERVRRDFPILERRLGGKPLVYLDNTATTQKPRAVIAALERYYLSTCSNVHRGLHQLSIEATADYEAARTTIARFIGAADRSEVVFTRGTTESINLVARALGDGGIGRGDEILITEMEHHSNIVPWQMLAERSAARLQVVPIDAAGELRMDELERLLSARTRLVAVTQISNAIGTRNPIEEIARLVHAAGSLLLVDGAQGVVHEPLDVRALACDFYAFSGHKIYGPTGIGVLYGRRELLDALPPFQGGGDMIRAVSFEQTTYNDVPHKFEAGTPNIAGAIGLAAALDYVESLGRERIAAHERALVARAAEQLGAVAGVSLYGSTRHRTGLVSFNVAGVHPHDVGTILDSEGIAVRAGHHCAQPLMRRLGVPATVRASFGCYTLPEEIDALVRGLDRVREVFH